MTDHQRIHPMVDTEAPPPPPTAPLVPPGLSRSEKGGPVTVQHHQHPPLQHSIPVFYQGHQNKTVFNVSLSGQVQSGSAIMTALQQQQQTGQVPLELKVHAPVAIKLGRLKLRKVKILGECMLMVDSLSANNLISIKASNCKFKLKL